MNLTMFGIRKVKAKAFKTTTDDRGAISLTFDYEDVNRGDVMNQMSISLHMNLGQAEKLAKAINDAQQVLPPDTSIERIERMMLKDKMEEHDMKTPSTIEQTSPGKFKSIENDLDAPPF